MPSKESSVKRCQAGQVLETEITHFRSGDIEFVWSRVSPLRLAIRASVRGVVARLMPTRDAPFISAAPPMARTHAATAASPLPFRTGTGFEALTGDESIKTNEVLERVERRLSTAFGAGDARVAKIDFTQIRERLQSDRDRHW